MKSVIFFLICPSLIFLAGCNSGDKGKEQNPDVVVADTVFETQPDVIGDSALYVKSKALLWTAGDSINFKLQKPRLAGIDTMSAKNIIDLINSNYDSIHVDFVKTSHDTIYIHIPRSEMLTERMGSTGAEMFMASTTYSLTELKGVKYVNFDFVEGDHAAPGVYDRSYFSNLQ